MYCYFIKQLSFNYLFQLFTAKLQFNKKNWYTNRLVTNIVDNVSHELSINRLKCYSKYLASYAWNLHYEYVKHVVIYMRNESFWTIEPANQTTIAYRQSVIRFEFIVISNDTSSGHWISSKIHEQSWFFPHLSRSFPVYEFQTIC